MPFSHCAEAPLAIAHRGLHGIGRPENSFAAFAAAATAGYALECDVRLAACRTVVVHHDALLADGRAIADVAAPAGLPTLAETLALIDGRVLIFIEAKAGNSIGPLARGIAVALTNYAGPAAVMSFQPRFAAAFRRHAPGRPAGLVARALPVRGLRSFDFLALEAAHAAGLGAARLAKALGGRPLLVWTVRSAGAARRLSFAQGLIFEAACAPAPSCS